MKKDQYIILKQSLDSHELLDISYFNSQREVTDYSIRNVDKNCSTKVLSFYTQSSSKLAAFNFLEGFFPIDLKDESGLIKLFRESLTKKTNDLDSKIDFNSN